MIHYKQDSDIDEPEPLQVRTFVPARHIMKSVQDQIDRLNTMLKTTMGQSLEAAISRQLQKDKQYEPTIAERLEAKVLRIQKHIDQIERLVGTLSRADMEQPLKPDMIVTQRSEQRKGEERVKKSTGLAKKGCKKPQKQPQIFIQQPNQQQPNNKNSQQSSSMTVVQGSPADKIYDDNINQLQILFNSEMYTEAIDFAKEMYSEYKTSRSFLYLYAKTLKQLKQFKEACKMFQNYYDHVPKNRTKDEIEKLLTVVSQWVSTVKQLREPKVEIPILEKAIKIFKRYKSDKNDEGELAYYLHSLVINYQQYTKKSFKTIKSIYQEALSCAELDYILADYADYLYKMGFLSESAEVTQNLLDKFQKVKPEWLDTGIKTQYKLRNYMDVKELLTKRQNMNENLNKEILRIQLDVEQYLGDTERVLEIKKKLR